MEQGASLVDPTKSWESIFFLQHGLTNFGILHSVSRPSSRRVRFNIAKIGKTGSPVLRRTSRGQCGYLLAQLQATEVGWLFKCQRGWLRQGSTCICPGQAHSCQLDSCPCCLRQPLTIMGQLTNQQMHASLVLNEALWAYTFTWAWARCTSQSQLQTVLTLP